MLFYWRSTLLLTTAILALTATRRNKALVAYFGAQIGLDLACIADGFHILTERYAFVWSLGTFCILVASFAYTLQQFRHESPSIRRIAALECCILPFFLSVVAFQNYLDRGIVLAFGAGAALLSLGVGLATVARWRPVQTTLAGLWLLLAGWNYAYGYGEVHAENLFDGLNQWLPATLVCSAFTGVVVSRWLASPNTPNTR